MNGKQSKRLRRQAEQQTVGKRWDNPHVQRQFDDNGKQRGIQIEHTNGCGRGRYHAAKKEFNNGSR